MAKMNSTNLYITTNQLVLKSNPKDPSTWQDLYRLAPYLRNSLCCVVCGNLLVEPLTPSSGKCQHHLCKKCKNGRKKIKPACAWCRDFNTPYTENKHLRILLQCYKKMCIMLLKSGIFTHLIELATKCNTVTGVERGAGNLVILIREGAAFQDDYKNNVGLAKSVYSILPCIYTNSSTQTLQFSQLSQSDRSRAMLMAPTIGNVANGSALYSVMYGDPGTKLTIKRKPTESSDSKLNKSSTHIKKEPSTRKQSNKCPLKNRRGCRCGNATPTPGKLTCCGQRCPCYVESKPCTECKCRGCRNPHLADGVKVRTHSSQIELYQSLMLGESQQQHQQQQSQQQQLQFHNKQSLLQNVNVEMDPGLTIEQLNEHLMVANIKVFDSYTKIPPSLPHAILVNDVDGSDDEELTVDI